MHACAYVCMYHGDDGARREVLNQTVEEALGLEVIVVLRRLLL